MKRRVVRMCVALVGAAAIAMPVSTWADDEAKDGVLGIEARAQVQSQQTIEGKLVDLHQYMTGGSASADPAGKAHAMWALDTPTGLVLLSDPHQRPPVAAGRPAVIERREERAEARIETRPGQRTERFEAQTTIYGIERRDIEAAQNRVKAQGTLHTRGGIKYLVVSSMSAASGAGAAGARPEGRIERNVEIESEVEIDRDN
jgi:hypothetical protein